MNSSHVRHFFDNSSTEMHINNNSNVKLPWGDIVSLTLNGSMAETDNDRYNLNQYRYQRQEEKNETRTGMPVCIQTTSRTTPSPAT